MPSIYQPRRPRASPLWQIVTAAIAAVHTFGDYLIFHPHLHVLAANGLFTPDGHFHCMPAEDLDPAIELFRHHSSLPCRKLRMADHWKAYGSEECPS